MNTVWTATTQRLIPDQVRSVVMPAGFAAVGPVAATAGPTATLAVAALVLGIPGAVVALLPAVRAVRIDAEETENTGESRDSHQRCRA